MSEWSKVKLTGNLCFKFAGLLLMAIGLFLGISLLRSSQQKQLLGVLLAGLFAMFLLGYGLFYWAGSRYLFGNPITKQIRFKQLLRKEQTFSIYDLTSITILKYSILLEFHNHCYFFQYTEENAAFINFLKNNSSLWNSRQDPVPGRKPFRELAIEPEPEIQKNYPILTEARRLLLMLLFVFTFILLLNLAKHLLVIILLCSILVVAFLLHLSNCLLMSKLYNGILQNGSRILGTISRISFRNGRRGTPHFTFEDEKGIHEVESLVPMCISKKEKAHYLGSKYTVWYAPTQSSCVLYGKEEPEPLPIHFLHFVILSQMNITLIFLLILYFVSS